MTPHPTARSACAALLGALFVLAGSASRADAQEFYGALYRGQPERPNVATALVSFDPSPRLGVGYGRVLRLGAFGVEREALVFGGVAAPIFLLPRANAGDLWTGTSSFVGPGRWNVLVGLGARAQAFDNGLSSGTSFKLQLSAAPGYYADAWYVRAGVELRSALLTYLTHSDLYRAAYPDAQDGWYKGTAHYLCGTLGAGARLFGQVELGLEAGLRAPTSFESYDPYVLPYVATLRVAHTF